MEHISQKAHDASPTGSRVAPAVAKVTALVLVSGLGMGLFQAQAWVSFVTAHSIEGFLPYAFPFEPFLSSLLGQTLALILAITGRMHQGLIGLFSHPATLLVCVLGAGTCSIASFLSQNHALTVSASFFGGLIGTPLLLAWGVFFCDQQPRYSAMAIALGFFLSCLITLAVAALGFGGVVAAIISIPLFSLGVWLVCVRMSNRQMPLRMSIHDKFTNVFWEDSSNKHGLGSVFGRNSTLFTFAICSFVIYLMEQFVFSGDNNPPGYMLYAIIVAVVIVMVFCLYSGFGRHKDPDILWPLFVLAIFGALLTIPFLWGTNSDVAANISIVASRSLTTFTWIVLVTTISRFSLEPFRAFAFGMIVTSLLPWLVAFMLSTLLNLLIPNIQSSIGSLALVLAFILAGSIIIHFMRMNAHNQSQLPLTLALPNSQDKVDTDHGRLTEEARGELVAADIPEPAISGTIHGPRYIEAMKIMARDHHLTARETEVTSLILQGWTLPEIAEFFVLSMNTVRTHYGHAYQKLGIHKKAELRRLFESYLT